MTDIGLSTKMDTVILTNSNNVATQEKERIKVVVLNNPAEQISQTLIKTESVEETDQVSNVNGNNASGMGESNTSSMRSGCTQTSTELRGQGDYKSIQNSQFSPVEKKILCGRPGFIQKQTATNLGNGPSTAFVPYVGKNQDALEEIKRKVSLAFMKQQMYQLQQQRQQERDDRNNPKSAYVPGTDYEYRTPGANFKNKNGKIKRPMNAFMVWARDYRGRLASSMLNATNSEISVKLGQIWANMPADEKQQYYDVAEKIKAKHRHDYPNWVYQPCAQKKDEPQAYMRNPTPPPINALLKAKLGLGESASIQHSSETLQNQESEVKSENPDAGVDVQERSTAACVFIPKHSQPVSVDQSGSISRSFKDSNSGQLISMTHVSQQSRHVASRDGNVSNAVRGLLANKLTSGRIQNGGQRINSNFDQRTPHLKQNISSTVKQDLFSSTVGQPRIAPTGSTTSLLSNEIVQINQKPYNQPRILGIMTSATLGRMPVQSNLRVHAVRPTLLKGLHPNAQLAPHSIQYKQHHTETKNVQQNIDRVVKELKQEKTVLSASNPIQRTESNPVISIQNKGRGGQAIPVHCKAKDIPIVETSISPISPQVRPGNTCHKRDNVSNLPCPKPARIDPTTEIGHSDGDNLQTTSSSDGSRKSDASSLDTLLQEDTRLSTNDFEDKLKMGEEDKRWPFPFSDNPETWDVKDVPSAFYMELYDPYDPFLNTDVLLSDKFPGSLHLEMDRWKEYLEDDDNDSDPLESFKKEIEDNIFPSPLPLKQTLGRLLNARVQESENGDIVTGDLLIEANLVESENDDSANVEDFEKKELLTLEMAIELSRSLKQAGNGESIQIVEHILNSVLDDVEMLTSNNSVTRKEDAWNVK